MKMGKSLYNKTAFFATSKCFIAPPATDFPMPPQHWSSSPAPEVCAIETCATEYVAISTSYEINDLFLYHMNAMVDIEICANKYVNSTTSSTSVNCRVSYNMQMKVNIKTCNDLEGIKDKSLSNSLLNRNISNVKACKGIKKSRFSKKMLKVQTYKEFDEINKPLYKSNELILKTCQELEESNNSADNKIIKTCKQLERINSSLNNTSILITYEEFEGFLNWLNIANKLNFKTCREYEGNNYCKSFSMLNIVA